jgi:DNA-binding SARP family transcriptional activator
VVARVEMPVETDRSDPARGRSLLCVELLGPLAIRRPDGSELALPGSRKVRALAAYLSLAPQAVPRARLCELLWDVPNDPRG